MSKLASGIYECKGVIQNYAWGGATFIPNLLNIENNHRDPYAEYWLGVHPKGMSMICVHGEWQPLSKYQELSFLFKILDVASMLSIQSHPTKEQAVQGYTREEGQNIPINSFTRVYKDQNAKPEMMVALSDFYLLHGFKPLQDIVRSFHTLAQLARLDISSKMTVKEIVHKILTLDDQINEDILRSLRRYWDLNPPKDKSDPDFWAYKALQDHGFDKGIYIMYMMHLIHLHPGEAIFQEAGLLHAYLEGQNLEIMNSSDNVFRCGLTKKHIALDELQNHLTYSPIVPQIITPKALDEFLKSYHYKESNFAIDIIELPEDTLYKLASSNTEFLVILNGGLTIGDQYNEMKLNSGSTAYLHFMKEVTIKSTSPSKFVRAKAVCNN